jgi:hypothetical protein
MRVECTSILNELAPNEPAPAVQKQRLTVAKQYEVLEVSFNHRVSMCWYRIECDDGKPWLILSTQFTIVSNEIPRSWVVSQCEGGITFCPAAWLQDGFWSRLAESNPEARNIYEQEKQKLGV